MAILTAAETQAAYPVGTSWTYVSSDPADEYPAAPAAPAGTVVTVVGHADDCGSDGVIATFSRDDGSTGRDLFFASELTTT